VGGVLCETSRYQESDVRGRKTGSLSGMTVIWQEHGGRRVFARESRGFDGSVLGVKKKTGNGGSGDGMEFYTKRKTDQDRP